ncbi:MAG TPA: hypothetical protein VK629_16365, partial [Steroidobacteraceae bacterium]|nr:hypothetical protein [Steroidobacteraceae bacterium]
MNSSEAIRHADNGEPSKAQVSRRATKLARCVATVLAVHAAQLIGAPAFAQAGDDTTLDQVVVTGTRVADRTRLD